MEKTIFETSYLGSKVTVYEDRLVWKFVLRKQTIPINQIASVDTTIPLYAQVVVETTGGEKYKIPVQPFAKGKLDEAIKQAMSGSRSVSSNSSNLDELQKLADLKERGVINQEEFEAKKKQLLGL